MYKYAGDGLAILRADLKSQKKHVKSLKKKSLWSKILEEVASQSCFIFYFVLDFDTGNVGSTFYLLHKTGDLFKINCRGFFQISIDFTNICFAIIEGDGKAGGHCPLPPFGDPCCIWQHW